MHPGGGFMSDYRLEVGFASHYVLSDKNDFYTNVDFAI
jgi:hypothetical protein